MGNNIGNQNYIPPFVGVRQGGPAGNAGPANGTPDNGGPVFANNWQPQGDQVNANFTPGGNGFVDPRTQTAPNGAPQNNMGITGNMMEDCKRLPHYICAQFYGPMGGMMALQLQNPSLGPSPLSNFDPMTQLFGGQPTHGQPYDMSMGGNNGQGGVPQGGPQQQQQQGPPDPFSDRGMPQNPQLGPVFDPRMFRQLPASRSLPDGVSPGATSAWRQFTQQDQLNFTAVRQALGDQAMQAQLDTLAEKGALQNRDFGGNSLISNLARLAAQPTSGLDSQKLLQQAVSTVANPEGIQKSAAGTSTAANVQYMMARQTPSEMVRMFSNLVSPEGWTTTAGGRHLQRVDNSLADPPGGNAWLVDSNGVASRASGASTLDRVMQAALTQQGRRGFAHDAAQYSQTPEAKQDKAFQGFVNSYDQTLNHTNPLQQEYDAVHDQFVGLDNKGRPSAAGTGLTAQEQAHLLNNSLGADMNLISASDRGADRLTTMMDLALNRKLVNGLQPAPILTTMQGAKGPLQVLVSGVDTKGGNVTFQHLGDRSQGLDLSDNLSLKPDANGVYTLSMADFQKRLDSAFIPNQLV